MLYANYFICSLEVSVFDNLSNLKYKTTETNRKKTLIKINYIIAYRHILVLVSIAYCSTNFVNAEYFFFKLPVLFWLGWS